ncbi:hypothetical protein [Clostridium ihumii]|uniref:DUF7922 domain-containing protein n=1 Tax=Clostridium ihumii TaxID=1470356 RepID=UPI00054E1CDC|nr:hypothetical protein [Clostridium ihumii]
MASKKSYSRFFIILQEDEKGHGLSSDKAPSGYTKIEVKNNKCKLSYYVQNLKKSDTSYYMALICDKKDIKNIIKLSKMNIDEHGRADIVCEYDGNNIGNVGINVESISGSAIIAMNGKNVKCIMNGFITPDVSNEWRKYEVITEQNLVREINEVKFDEYEKKIEDKKIEEQKIQDSKADASKIRKESVKETTLNENFNEEKELENSDIEDRNDVVESQQDEKISIENVYENIKNGSIELTEEELEDLLRHKKKSKESDKEYCNCDECNECDEEKHKDKKEKKEKKKNDEECDEHEKKEKEHKKEEKDKLEYEECYECKDKEKKEKKEFEIDFKYEDNIIENKNAMNKFFKEIVKDFEEVEGYNDIKNCKWYKVKIYQLEDMYCMNDYKKYTVIYYPMICYYPYISKYKHCMIGHKHDKDGNLKYIVYAIPGNKSEEEQPYGGKTGFVTWMPNKENTDYGYWLMFYDFKNSTVVVPVKK